MEVEDRLKELGRREAAYALCYSPVYETMGTVADFSQHPSCCIWNPDIKSIFLPDMRAIAKKHHGTRIKSIEADNNLDHIDLTITYY